MKKSRYNILKEIINKGYWDIDLDNGVVYKNGKTCGYLTQWGYLRTSVAYNGKSYNFAIHEIIAIYGGLVPIDITIDHINNNKLDNRFCNLQLLSNEDNSSKAHRGISNPLLQGTNNVNSKLTDEDVIEIKKILKEGQLSLSKIANLYNVSKKLIINIKQGKTWKHIK